MRWLIYVLLLLISITSFAVTTITDLTSEIRVQKDASVMVTERFTVDSDGTQIHHGIYRDIPVNYKTHGGMTKRIGLEIINTTLNDQPVPFSHQQNGNQIRIKMGDPNVNLPAGRYTFQLIYKATQELGFFKNHDELYWNVTGNNWLFPIENVTATVVLPNDAMIFKTKAYTGLFGATEQNYNSTYTNSSAVFKTSGPLSPGEGLTIVVGWQKGVIPEPDFAQNIFNSLHYYQSLFLMMIGLVIVSVYYFIVWLIVKKKSPIKRAIFPLFRPPEGFDSADLRYILMKKFDDRAFVAAILSLASKGYLKIEQVDKEYRLIREKRVQVLSVSEQRLLQDLFYNTDGVIILGKDNADRISEAIYNYKKKLKEEYSRKYFVRSTKYYLIGAALSLLTFIFSKNDTPYFIIFGVITLGFSLIKDYVRFKSFRIWILIGIFVFLLLPLFYSLFAGNLEDIIYFVLGVIIIAINIYCYYNLNYYTQEGQTILEQILGFRMFLNATEKQRMQMATVPELTSELFERFLPYAVAFDVEKNWSDQFVALFTQENYKPTWYVGPDFNYTGFTSNFPSKLSTAMGAAVATTTVSVPGSSSGFGGGGSSGGGGGGGGGGGW